MPFGQYALEPSAKSAAIPINPRRRRSAPKSRSGCRTCKLRRVRCDEARPCCRNCQRQGIVCDGYLHLKPFNPEMIADPTEKRGFFYFHTETRPQLTSFAELHFWDQLALQRSYSEETIRQVIVAIGAFHESLETADADLRVARQHTASTLYQRALAKTNAALPQMSIADVLLASVLLAFLDNIKGDEFSAYRHISGAAAIAEEHCAANAAQGHSLVVSRVLAPIIDSMAATVHNLYAPSITLLIGAINNEPFVNFLDAHDQFYSTAKTISMQLKGGASLTLQGDDLFNQLHAWWERFSDFLERSNGTTCKCDWPHSHAHHTLGALYLEIMFLTTRTRLHCALTGLETTFDLHEPTYHRILTACEQIAQILKSSPNTPTSARTCLGFMPTHLLACWMIAEGSRNPFLRRRAIAILRGWHLPDPLWDTRLVADVAESLVCREERGSPIQPVTCAQDISESARIRFLKSTFFKLDPKTSSIGVAAEPPKCDFIRLSVLSRLPVHAAYGGDGGGGELGGTALPPVGVEVLWVDRRYGNVVVQSFGDCADAAAVSGMPGATGGLFPQVTASSASSSSSSAVAAAVGQTKLWDMLDETRTGEELLRERRWTIVHPPFDRVPVLVGGNGGGDGERGDGGGDGGGVRGEREGTAWRKRKWDLPSPSVPLDERIMGVSLRNG